MMRLLVLFGLLIFAGCSTTRQSDQQRSVVGQVQAEPKIVKKEKTVRLTGYWKAGGKTDKWTAAGKTSTGYRLNRSSHMAVCAVDPAVIPYGSIVVIPEYNLRLLAVDTGGAVVSRKASRKFGRNDPVVDIFFYDRAEAYKFMRGKNISSLFVKAYVIPPNKDS